MEHVSSIEALGAQLEKFISTKTVFGEPVVAGRVTLIPIQQVSFRYPLGLAQAAARAEMKRSRVQV